MIFAQHQVNLLVQSLEYVLRKESGHNRISCTSLAGDPLHEGHINCIHECKNYGNILVVIVNGNGFLERKKGYYVVDEITRATIIDNFKDVNYTLLWDDGTQFVDKAISILQPYAFCKGGDRKLPNISREEVIACEKIGCKMVYGVGGFDKVGNSSKMFESAVERYKLSNSDVLDKWVDGYLQTK